MTAPNGTFDSIEPYLTDLDARLDPDTEDALLEQWARVTDGQFTGDVFSPRRQAAAPPGLDWPSVSVNQTLDDFDAMALQQLKACSDDLAAGSGALPAVRCNYGTGILPGIFGAEPFVMPDELNTLPTCRPLAGGAAAVEAALDAGVPDVRTGPGGTVLDMAEHFQAIGRRHANIGRYVHLYHPDIQGPLDVCEMLWGSSIFLALVDRADLVHAMLDLITETYIAVMNAWETLVPPANGRAVHWRMMHRGRIMIRDDSAMNISPEMVDEFARPYDQRLLDTFGGGGVHFCGRGDHYIASYGRLSGLGAIAMSQPELNDMETIYRNTVDRGIALLGLQREAAEAALSAGRDLHGLVHCW